MVEFSAIMRNTCIPTGAEHLPSAHAGGKAGSSDRGQEERIRTAWLLLLSSFILVEPVALCIRQRHMRDLRAGEAILAGRAYEMMYAVRAAVPTAAQDVPGVPLAP